MFGRRRRKGEAQESVREAERRALFAELAKRPESVCPFLGIADARAAYRPEPNGEHRCYAFGDPAPLSDEQQRHVCLERGYSNCPRYLRGVLVIPSEELEALRHPQAPAPPPAPSPAPAARGGGRRGLALVGILVILIAAVGVGGWYLLGNANDGTALGPTATPTASPSPTPLVTPPASGPPTGTPAPATPTPVPTPIAIPSSGILPTPGPSDQPTGGYAVVVKTGSYRVFRLDDTGAVISEATAVFAPQGVPYSGAPVERVIGQDGRIYWRTLVGTYTGLAYTKELSGDFSIYDVYETPTGEARFQKLPPDQL